MFSYGPGDCPGITETSVWLPPEWSYRKIILCEQCVFSVVKILTSIFHFHCSWGRALLRPNAQPDKQWLISEVYWVALGPKSQTPHLELTRGAFRPAGQSLYHYLLLRRLCVKFLGGSSLPNLFLTRVYTRRKWKEIPQTDGERPLPLGEQWVHAQ